MHLARFVGGFHCIRSLGRHRQVQFVHNHATLAGIGINALQYGTALEIAAEPIAESYLLVVLLAGHGELVQGTSRLALGVDCTAVVNPDRPFHLRMSAEEHNLTVRIPGPLLRDAAARMLGRHETGTVEFTGTAPARGLRRLLGGVCAELDDAGTPLVATAAGSGIGEALGATLLRFLLAEVPHNLSAALNAPVAIPPGSRHVQRAREFIHASLGSPVTLADVAAAAGTSARTLQVGFQRLHGCSPLQYLRARRLELARAELERAATAWRSVTEIACDCGFTHMAKFSRAYRERYGETPSATRGRVLRGDAGAGS